MEEPTKDEERRDERAETGLESDPSPPTLVAGVQGSRRPAAHPRGPGYPHEARAAVGLLPLPPPWRGPAAPTERGTGAEPNQQSSFDSSEDAEAIAGVGVDRGSARGRGRDLEAVLPATLVAVTVASGRVEPVCSPTRLRHLMPKPSQELLVGAVVLVDEALTGRVRSPCRRPAEAGTEMYGGVGVGAVLFILWRCCRCVFTPLTVLWEREWCW